MTEGHIYIYGEISGYQGTEASLYGAVNLKEVVKQIHSAGDVDTINVHIHSPGGDVFEGYAIHDALVNSGKNIVTIIEGLCASIATVVALAGSERKMTANAEFMIHNPWGMSIGDSSELKRYADSLEEAETKMAAFYASKTGGDSETFRELMKAETWMSAEKAKELGFVTEIIEQVKAVAKININNNKAKMEDFEKKAEGFFAKMEKFFAKFKPKALIVTMGGGEQLDFGEEVIEVEDIKEGTPVKPADDNPIKPEYTLPDGTIIYVEGGKVTKIEAPEAEPENEELEAANAKIAELQAELDGLKASATEAINAKVQLESEMLEMKSLVSDMKDTFEKKERGNGEQKAEKVNRSVLK